MSSIFQPQDAFERFFTTVEDLNELNKGVGYYFIGSADYPYENKIQHALFSIKAFKPNGSGIQIGAVTVLASSANLNQTIGNIINNLKNDPEFADMNIP